jgi:threonine dehydrogenase-like Zn-dependent dehydrogenase
MVEKAYGYSPSGLFGYSHMLGGYAGGQAQYVRVPFADVGPIKIPESVRDEQVLFLSDIFPTGYQAAEDCNIQPGDSVAIWGCGPVGQFAIASALMLGAERIIAIDRIPERLRLAATQERVTVLNYQEVAISDALHELTGGRGPDACIDAVGMEAHGRSLDALYDQVKASVFLATDRLHVLRQAIQACRKGGTIAIPVPLGAAFAKGLTLKMGQTHVHKYLHPLLARIERGEIDPAFVITHRLRLEDAPHGYEIFKHKKDECIKIVLQP